MEEHQHKWGVLSPPNNLECTKCHTVSDIETVVHNTAINAAKAMKIELYAAQLYARDLRKVPHVQAYAWIIANSPAIVESLITNEPKQESIL